MRENEVDSMPIRTKTNILTEREEKKKHKKKLIEIVDEIEYNQTHENYDVDDDVYK